MTTPRRLRTTLLIAVAFATPAAAQLTPIDPATSAFQVTEWGGNFFLESFLFQESERRRGVSTDQYELFSQQGVELWGKGFIYHPNFIDYAATIRVGATYDDVEINDDAGTNTGVLLGYDLSALILKEKQASGRVFATYSDQFQGRSFTRPVQINRRNEGFELFYRAPVNVSLYFEHAVTKEDSDFRVDDSETFLTRLHVTDNRDRDRFTDLIYEHEDVDRTLDFADPDTGPLFTQDLSETRDEVTVVNRWTFGQEPLQHHLTGGLRAAHREGVFNNDLFQINQRLDLSHTPTLQSFYSGAFSIDNTDAQSERTINGEIGVIKRIYDSLVLVASIDARDREFDDGAERAVGGTFEADYTKNTPIGRYTSGLTLGRRYEQERSDTGQRTITDEAVRLVSTDWVQLNFASVVPGSVTVTDASNVVTLIEGVDYELRNFGSFTEIRRIVTSPLTAEGDTVLVDYVIDIARDADFHTDTLRWSHRIRFDAVPLAVYGEYALRNEVLDSGVDPGNLERDERWLVGSEVFLDALTLAAEYERRKLELAPGWDGYRFRATYLKALTDESSISATARYEMLNYKDAREFELEPGRDFRESYGANVNFTTKIQRSMLLRLEASYLRSRGRNNDELLRIGPSFTWKQGALELTISGYQAFYTQEEVEGDTTYLSVQFKRHF